MVAEVDIGAAVSPMLVAGVLLLAHKHLRARGLPGPTVEEITAATGVSRSRAYEVRDELRRVLPSLLRPVGRPPSSPREVNRDVAYALLRTVTAFIRAHPGCVSEGPERTYYGDAFRSYGANRFLYAGPADAENAPHTVRKVAEGIWLGYMDFSIKDRARKAVNWLALCRNAYHAINGPTGALSADESKDAA